MSNLVCRQCGYENDTTRVFCHNCGTRLADAGIPAGPAPVVPPSQPGVPASAAAPSAGKLYVPPVHPDPVFEKPKTAKPPVRSRSLDAPQKRPSLVRAIVSTALLGAALAAIIQMFRAPNGIPAALTPNEAQATDVFQKAESAAVSPYPRVLAVSTEQVNNFLAVRIVSAASADEPAYRPKFQRAFVLPGNGDFRFFVEERLGQLPVYIYLTQEPVLNGTSVSMNTKAGGIGRLPIHPSLFPLIQRLVDPVLASVGDVLGPIRNLSAVTVTPTGASLSWQGAPAKSAPAPTAP